MVAVMVSHLTIASLAMVASAQTQAPPTTSAASKKYYNKLQLDYAHYMLNALAAAVVLYFTWKSYIRLTLHVRRLHGMANGTQRYFAREDYRMSWFKKHVVNAPIFRVRHSREFQLSWAVNMGTLPTRFQALCVMGLIAMNTALCTLHIPYNDNIATWGKLLRNRTGTLATANLIPLVILAGRNNPLVPMLGISFDSWNFYHRWIGRIFAAEALVHFFCYLFYTGLVEGWNSVTSDFQGDEKAITGLVTFVGIFCLVVTAVSPVRHAFYETFLHLHILLALTAFVGLWYHLLDQPQQPLLIGALVLWGLERFTRFYINFYRNLFGGRTSAKVEVLPGDATKITLKLARPWTFRPGQHLFLCIPSVGLWTFHPFSVAWSENEPFSVDEKGLVSTQQDVLTTHKETISLLARCRTGFTDILHKRASKGINGHVCLFAFVEGPYGAIHNLDSYGTVLLYAGGIGITHHVPFIRYLVQGYADGSVAARRVTLVWAIQSPEHLEWIRPWMTSILQMDRCREVLRIMLFITQPRSANDISSPTETIEMFSGRPDIQTILDKEIEQQIGAMGVMVCGSGALSDDVREACRERQCVSKIDYIEESFSW